LVVMAKGAFQITVVLSPDDPKTLSVH